MAWCVGPYPFPPSFLFPLCTDLKPFAIDDVHLHKTGDHSRKPLAVGGFGSIYKVRFHRQLCVAKFLNAVTRENLDAFVSEATITSRFSHFHIVRLIGVCLDPGRLAIVLEFCERGSLEAVLTKEPLTLGQGLMTMLSQTATALSYLHSRGFVHLDIKSGNVLIRDDYSAVLTDFGETKRSDSVSKIKAGSHFYVAPEITEGRDYGFPSDIFSFGILLLECGAFYLHKAYLKKRWRDGKANDHPIQVAFEGMDVSRGQEASGKIALEGWRPAIPPALREHWPDFVDLIKRCWAQDPSERPSAQELVTELAACESDHRGREIDKLLGAHLSEEDRRQYHEFG